MGFQVGGHTGIENHDLCAGLPGQHIYASPASKKVEDHLRRDFLRIGADPFGYHAMIAGGQNHGFTVNSGYWVAEHAGQHYGQVFQPTQAAQGLGKGVLTGPGSSHRLSSRGAMLSTVMSTSGDMVMALLLNACRSTGKPQKYFLQEP